MNFVHTTFRLTLVLCTIYCMRFAEGNCDYSWSLVFNGVKGAGRGLFNLWAMNGSHNADNEQAKRLDNSFQGHYKSEVVQYWPQLNITEVKVALYTEEKEVTYFIFDGKDSDQMNWFSKERLIDSPYRDLNSTTETAVFSIEGVTERQDRKPHTTRNSGSSFFIGLEHLDCESAGGWLIVLTADNLEECNFKKEPGCQFMFSKGETNVGWNTENIGTADVFAIFVKSSVIFDPCESYAIIDDKYRSVAYSKIGRSAHYICDMNLKSDWYRFTSEAGSQMPTSCVGKERCGTKHPVWLHGELPTVGEYKHVNACISAGVNHCCSHQMDMMVKNCGRFNVYRLNPLPMCPAAYCAGDIEPCPPGFVSPNGGFQPGCTEEYPQLETHPVLTPKFNKIRNHGYLECLFTGPSVNNVTYEVLWLMDDKLIKTTAHSWKSNIDMLFEHEYVIGCTVECHVFTRFHDSEVSSPAFASNGVFIGVKVSPDYIVTREDLTAASGPGHEVSIWATVPMSCKIELKAERALRSRRPEILMSTCAVYIKRESYNVLNKVTFDSVRDFQIDGDQYLTVYMQPSDQCSASVKEGYRERITVQSRDVVTGRCTSNGDPHYNTYDGRYFDNYIEGDFVLHRSQNRYFEVHTRTWRCWRVACNCGVVVRENNDVVGVTMCDGEWGKTAPRVIKYSDGNFTAGVSIAKNKSGKRFTIKMPSGSKVVMKTGMWGMNVELTVPGDDFGGTVGLCGVFDDDVTNDYTMSDGNISEYTRRRPHEFISSWMIPSGNSLFDKVPDKIEDGLQNREDRHRGNENCECFIDAKPGENKEGGCSMSGRARRAMGRRQTMTSITELVNDTKSKLGSRRKLKRAEAIKRKRRIQREVLGGEVTWPTEGGITFENAEERCRSAILESPIAGHCADVPGVDLFLGLEGCIEDIGLTDSFDLVYVAVEEMIDHCEDVAVKNVSLYSDDAEEKSPPSFLSDFICPQQCSYHGDCLDGVCHCHKDYGGSDCSVDLTRPPDVWFIEGSEHHGLCDVRSGFCRSISIIGDNFLNSEALKCHYEFVRMDDQGWTAIDKNSIEADVFFVSFREVYCQPKETILDIGSLDENTGITSVTLRVTASNDAGITESKGMAITIYDSKCLHCDNTGLCTLKESACEINGQCFAHGEYHPTNAELQCLSDKDQYKWSVPDGFVGFTLIAMAIGIPIAGLVMAAVTVVLTFWLYKRLKAKVDTI